MSHYRFCGSESDLSSREGVNEPISHGISWCESKLLLIAPQNCRKRISHIVSYFLLFLLPFNLAASIFSLRYALLRLPPKLSREGFDRVFSHWNWLIDRSIILFSSKRTGTSSEGILVFVHEVVIIFFSLLLADSIRSFSKTKKKKRNRRVNIVF